MPIYEYACRACGSTFEALVRSDTEVKCPGCHSASLDKLLSVFATSTSTASQSHVPQVPQMPAGCGSCGHPGGPGACAFS